MTSYERIRQAIRTINPAIKDLDPDELQNVLTIVIDKYLDERGRSCRRKVEYVSQILRAFEELRENV